MPDVVALAATSPGWSSTAGTSYLLIALAEFGDKSQLACMTLAARHRPLPVMLGAGAAFVILNLLAVAFGSAVANWLPEWLITTVVALLFAYFGISSLRHEEESDDDMAELPGHSIFISAFLMIFLAEFGDKTQLAVAGLGSGGAFVPVWIGSTIALLSTSALGIFAGQKLIGRLPLGVIHRISGVFFLALAALAASRLVLG